MTKEELKAKYQLAVADMLESKMSSAEKKFDDFIEAAHQSESFDEKDVLNAYVNKLHLTQGNRDKIKDLEATMLGRFGDTELGAEVLQHLAQFYHINGDKVRHLQLMQNLMQKYPNTSTEALLDLGLACLSNGQVQPAVMYFIKYLNQSDALNKQIAAVNLADCYNALGSPKEAKAILARYMK